MIDLLEQLLAEMKEVRSELAELRGQRMLTNKEVAERLGCSYATVRNMIHRGELKPVMVGSSHRHKASDIEELRARTTVEIAADITDRLRMKN